MPNLIGEGNQLILTSKDRKELGRATTAIWQLIELDTFWTAAAAEPSQVELEDALTMAGEMLRRVTQMPSRANDVVRVGMRTLGDQVERPFPEDLLEILPTEDSEVVSSVFSRYSPTSIAQIAAEDLQDLVDNERELIRTDILAITSGEVGMGYLSTPFLCSMAKLSMAAGLMTIWVPPHAHAAAAVATGVAVFKARGCGKL